jgi:hypothetical protein
MIPRKQFCSKTELNELKKNEGNDGVERGGGRRCELVSNSTYLSKKK